MKSSDKPSTFVYKKTPYDCVWSFVYPEVASGKKERQRPIDDKAKSACFSACHDPDVYRQDSPT